MMVVALGIPASVGTSCCKASMTGALPASKYQQGLEPIITTYRPPRLLRGHNVSIFGTCLNNQSRYRLKVDDSRMVAGVVATISVGSSNTSSIGAFHKNGASSLIPK